MKINQIARHYGGTVSNGNAVIPTPGHSGRDRGTSIKLDADAPDGVLVKCFNGDTADALIVKAMLRSDGFLESRKGKSLTPTKRHSAHWADLAAKSNRLAAVEAAANSARDLWLNSDPAEASHPYLIAKKLEPIGSRQSNDVLLVPMVDADYCLWNIQRIKPDGFKLFAKGARTAGLFWPHKVHCQDGSATDGPLVIGEGFATMAVIHAETGLGVVAAMTAGNLETVAKTMRRMFPDRPIAIAADDDSHLPDNLGLRAAYKAAGAIGAVVATPRLDGSTDGSGADFADIPREEVAGRIFAPLGGE